LRQNVLTSDLRADSVDWQSMAGWKRLVLMGLMVAVPVPLFAASGLAVPLPSVVYRVAVGIAESTHEVAVRVPGLGTVEAESTHVARAGTITFSAQELASRTARARSSRAPEAHPSKTQRPEPAAGRAERGARTPLRPKARSTRADRVSRKIVPDFEFATAKAAGPAARGEPQESPRGRSEPAHEQKQQVIAGEPRAGTPADPGHLTEPKVSLPKEEATTNPKLAPPPPPPPAPSLPRPLPVTTPVDPTPDAVHLTPAAQLENIADDLRALVEKSPGTRRAERIQQVLDKVESARARLEKTPPDNQGAVGDIRNAVQKLDSAFLEGVITLVEHTDFKTRLKAISLVLEVSN
jgi:hypothetical protein